MKKNTLKKRVFSSILILSVVYAVIFYFPIYLYLLINSVAIALALYEFYTLTEKSKLYPNKVLGITLGITFPLFIYFPGDAIVFASAIMILLFSNFKKKNEYSGLINSASTIFGLVYVALFLSFFTKLRYVESGPTWVAYVIAVTKIGDAGAYFVGSNFGKNKPLKTISPNKSIEGAVGGLLTSILISVIFYPFIPNVIFWHFIILGILLSIIGQLGDLTESLIKRECETKDSGVIPGLGGMLDILDSLLFNAPFLFYYIKVFIES